jgi:hypothetical protein
MPTLSLLKTRAKYADLVRIDSLKWARSRCLSSRRSGGGRISSLQQKQQDLFSMIDNLNHDRDQDLQSKELGHENAEAGTIARTPPTTTTMPRPTEKSVLEDEKKMARFKQERRELLRDAGYMTRSLYRSCLRSIYLIRKGNENDMAEFQQREEQEKSDRLNRGPSMSFSFEPPVDRENELSSRALYYLAFVNESFHQEVDCLISDPWKEDQVTRFIHLMREGEEKRKWVLKEYKFEDSFSKQWNGDMFNDWEARARQLIFDSYQLKGWLFQKDFINDDDDGINDDVIIDWGEDDVIDDDESRKRIK